MDLTFRPYQEKLLLQVKHHLSNGGDALIEQPTGSGKTFEMVAISASLLGTKYSHIVIAAPQQQIEEGFVSDKERIFQFELDGAASSQIKVSPDFIQPSRDDGRDGIITNLTRYLNNANSNKYAVVCTHAALNYLTRQELSNSLPISLVNYLLIIDEAHHAPAEGLSELIEAWKERGGSLLYATATPYRKDGKPVKREDMKLFRRLLAEHMEEGFAPAELQNEIIGISVPDEVSALEFFGEEISKSDHRKMIIDAIYDTWVRDGKPKAIVRVPPGNSTEFIEELTNKFSGVRILNGAGTDKSDQKRFIGALKNSNEKDYDTSEYDIVVGVQRVLEGTDWAVCSHVYCVGIPGSLTMITQLIGRSLRKKGDNHPYKNKVAVSFFVLGATENALKNLEIKHSRHALLNCIFMADYNVGQEWIVSKQIVKGITSGLANGDISPDAAADAEANIRCPISQEDRANVSLILVDAINSAQEKNEAISVSQIIDLIKNNDQVEIDEDIINQIVVENLASRQDEIGERILATIEAKTKKYIRLFPAIDKAKRKIFNEIVKEFREETLEDSPVSIGIMNQIHKLTGGQIKDFCNRLNKNNLKLDIIEKWVSEFYRKYGKYPSGFLKPNDPLNNVEGTSETWRAITEAFRLGIRGLKNSGYSSLANFIDDKFDRPSFNKEKQLSIDEIKERILLFKDQYDRFPLTSGKDKNLCLEDTDLTWEYLQHSIYAKSGIWENFPYKSLADFVNKEFKEEKILYQDIEQIKLLVKDFYHTNGKFPQASTDYEWGRINRVLLSKKFSNYISLADFVNKEFNRKPTAAYSSISENDILILVKDFISKNGKYPTTYKNGNDLIKDDLTWRQIDNALIGGLRGLEKNKYKSLSDFIRVNFDFNRKKGNLSLNLIKEWIIEFIKNNKGVYPTQTSGEIYGTSETWKLINQSLSRGDRGLKNCGYNSLHDFIINGLGYEKIEFRKEKISVDQIKKWIERFLNQNKRYPSAQDKEIISEYGKNWKAIDAAIHYGHRGLDNCEYKSLADLITKEFKNVI